MPRINKSRNAGLQADEVEPNQDVVAGTSALESLPTELIHYICLIILDESPAKGLLLALRCTSRRICRVVSSVLNRHVVLSDIKGIAAFLECFHPTRKSVRRNMDMARSPLTTIQANEIRTLTFAGTGVAETQDSYWKNRFSLMRIYDTLQLVLSRFTLMQTFEWKLAKTLPEEILRVLETCSSMQTLNIAESFMLQDVEHMEDDELRSKDIFYAERQYPSCIKHLFLNISAHYASNQHEAWSEYITKCLSPTTLSNLRSIAINVHISSFATSDHARRIYAVDALFQHTFLNLRALGLRGVFVEESDPLKQFFRRHPCLEYLDFRTAETVARRISYVNFGNWHPTLVEAISDSLPALKGVSILPDDGLECTHALLNGRRPISAVAFDMYAEDFNGHNAAAILNKHHATGGSRIRRLLLYNASSTRDIERTIYDIAQHAPEVVDVAVFGLELPFYSTIWIKWSTAWSNLQTVTVTMKRGNLASDRDHTEVMANNVGANVPSLRKLVTHWVQFGVLGHTFVATWLDGPYGPHSIEVVLGTDIDSMTRWPKVWLEI